MCLYNCQCLYTAKCLSIMFAQIYNYFYVSRNLGYIKFAVIDSFLVAIQICLSSLLKHIKGKEHCSKRLTSGQLWQYASSQLSFKIPPNKSTLLTGAMYSYRHLFSWGYYPMPTFPGIAFHWTQLNLLPNKLSLGCTLGYVGWLTKNWKHL